MNLNQLNNHQIILLCLLVAFVTAIATGITTVSLMSQGSQPVTQTINQVVEKTIERVVPPTDKELSLFGTKQSKEKEIVTVVVNQEDAVMSAVEKNANSIARISSKDPATGTDVFVTLGIVIDNKGTILADARAINQNFDYTARYNKGTFNLKFEKADTNGAILSISDSRYPSDFSAVTFGDSGNLKIGQSIISITGSINNTALPGTITTITPAVDSLPIQIDTNLNEGVSLGSIFVNLKGEIIGARIGTVGESRSVFTPSNAIKSIVEGLRK
jgi:hypothetical protein